MTFPTIDIERLKSLLLYDQSSPLLFNTGLFMLLFLAFLLLYRLMRRWRSAKFAIVLKIRLVYLK